MCAAMLLSYSVMRQVAACVTTKDNGRYLPEWVAYHWALGVDEFDILDDDSVDDTREVKSMIVVVVMVFMGGGDGGCLLYTSPSPQDRQKSRMPSSA